MSHDYSAQRAETFDTFTEMQGQDMLPGEAVVYYQFYAEDFDPDWTGVEAALRARGFQTERDEEEGMVTASTGPIPVTPDSIWEQERIATEAALPFDFYPDGWELTTGEG